MDLFYPGVLGFFLCLLVLLDEGTGEVEGEGWEVGHEVLACLAVDESLEVYSGQERGDDGVAEDVFWVCCVGVYLGDSFCEDLLHLVGRDVLEGRFQLPGCEAVEVLDEVLLGQREHADVECDGGRIRTRVVSEGVAVLQHCLNGRSWIFEVLVKFNGFRITLLKGRRSVRDLDPYSTSTHLELATKRSLEPLGGSAKDDLMAKPFLPGADNLDIWVRGLVVEGAETSR